MHDYDVLAAVKSHWRGFHGALSDKLCRSFTLVESGALAFVVNTGPASLRYQTSSSLLLFVVDDLRSHFFEVSKSEAIREAIMVLTDAENKKKSKRRQENECMG